MIPRRLTERLYSGLKASPAILLAGARQVGKTTLMREIVASRGYHYLTLDDLGVQAVASADPAGFIARSPKPLILGEVQRCMELFLPLKADIDAHRVAGRYILTGSANPLLIPKVGEALTGRLLLHRLLPLSQGEILGKAETFLDLVFQRLPLDALAVSPAPFDLAQALLVGGYPAMRMLETAADRRDWCHSYLQLLLLKDVRDLARVEGLSQFPNLLHLLATRVGGLLNVQELSRTGDLASSTLRRYLQLLETLFLILFQPAWSNHLGKRLVKSPKVYFVDTALQLHLLGFDEQRLLSSPAVLGAATENFVLLELLKQASWSSFRHRLFHFRTHTGAEVDIVIEGTGGDIVGVEVKSSHSVRAEDFNGLKVLRAEAKERWVRGVVFYGGDKVLAFGPDLLALPYSALWG
jgi:uncharacterized protein